MMEYIFTEQSFDFAVYNEMYQKNIISHNISHNLKVTKEQIIEDLNGVMSSLQWWIMKELLLHIDEIKTHIQNLKDEIDTAMKTDEKIAFADLQDMPDIAKASA